MSDLEFTMPDDKSRLPHEQPRIPVPPDCPLPPDLPPDVPPGQVSREELELALERAKLVAEDCATVLDSAVQAMRDGAWVSSRGDEFSLELDEHVRIAGVAGERPVKIIENALDQLLGEDDPEWMPMRFSSHQFRLSGTTSAEV